MISRRLQNVLLVLAILLFFCGLARAQNPMGGTNPIGATPSPFVYSGSTTITQRSGYTTFAWPSEFTIITGSGVSIGTLSMTSISIPSTLTCDASDCEASNLTVTTIDLNGGAIDNTTIGATTPSTGAFSTLAASTSLSIPSALTCNTGQCEAANLTATTVDINGGAVDGTAIGATTPSTGAFSTISASTSIAVPSGSTHTTAGSSFLELTATTIHGTNITGGITIDSLSLDTALTVPNGGTGATTFTDGDMLIGNAAGPIQSITLTNGQLPIGSTGADPVPANITAGSGPTRLTVSDGAGTINIYPLPAFDYTGVSASIADGETYTPAAYWMILPLKLTGTSSPTRFTLAETNAFDGQILAISNAGANTITMGHQDTVQHVPGAGTISLGQGDTAWWIYDTDRWKYFGGAQSSVSWSSITLPNGTDPDVTAVGRISWDTDAANETADASIRGYTSGGGQVLIERAVKCFTGTADYPQTYTAAERNQHPWWHNNYGMDFHITEILAKSNTDNYSFTLDHNSWTNASGGTEIITLNTTENGTSAYYTSTTGDGIQVKTIAHDQMIYVDFYNWTNAGAIWWEVCGWFDANVD